jgi:DNA-binding beta-propeller fold protein YncE
MRRALPLRGAILTALLAGCGGNFPLPTEHRTAAVIPTEKSYAYLATWNGMDGIRDIMITQGIGSQLFILFNHGGTLGPSTPRGEVRLYPFTQNVPIGAPVFDPPVTLFNPVAIGSFQSKLFVLDDGDSCMAKFDPERGTCEADNMRNGRPSIIWDYSAIWRVREYPITGGDTISTFTDTSFASVSGIAADAAGNVYVSGTAVVLDTLSTDQRIRTRKFVSRIYRYARGPRYAGVTPNDLNMPGANWHRDTTWVVLDGTGTSSVEDPRRMVWTASRGGAVFVADRGNNKAKLIGTSDLGLGFVKLDGSETPTGTSFSGPEGVAVDGAGYLYVVDRLNQRVLRYDPDGAFVQQVNVEKNSDNLPLLDPIAVGVDNTLAYVADLGRAQVIRYQRRQ